MHNNPKNNVMSLSCMLSKTHNCAIQIPTVDLTLPKVTFFMRSSSINTWICVDIKQDITPKSSVKLWINLLQSVCQCCGMMQQNDLSLEDFDAFTTREFSKASSFLETNISLLLFTECV